MDAGTRVFGILDEASYAWRLDCEGVLAVDLDRTGTLQSRFDVNGSLIDDGGTVPVTLHPVAIDGFDDRRDRIGSDGGVIFIDAGIPDRFADTYYRPPNTFPDGGVRDANRMLPIRFANNGSVGVVQDIVIPVSYTHLTLP